MSKLLGLALALGLVGAGCNSSGPDDVPTRCLRPLATFDDCAPTYAEQQRAPPGADPGTCTNCEMCRFFSGRCGGYEVWRSSWAYGETRECLYDAATGALVGALRASDVTLEGCEELVGGVHLAESVDCPIGSPPPACEADGGRD